MVQYMLTYKRLQNSGRVRCRLCQQHRRGCGRPLGGVFPRAKRCAVRPAAGAYLRPGRAQRIDFFPALNAPPDAPILIAIHGGLWFLFDKWMMHFLVPAFTAAGVHVACPNYRLAPAVGLGDIVGDCRRAIAFVHENPRSHRIAGSGGILCSGHSAAGQLAAVMASTDWPEFDPRLPADMLAALSASAASTISSRSSTPASSSRPSSRSTRTSKLESRQPDPRRHAAGPSHHRREGIGPLP